MPATLNFVSPNAALAPHQSTLRVLTEAVAWPVTDHPRTAAVSSFGISGTNAHLIVQQAPSSPAAFASGGDASVGMPPLLVWAISARSPRALCAQAQRLHEHLISHPDVDLTDVAYSLATTRSHHPYRAVITSHRGTENARDHLLEVLQALGADQPHPQLTSHHHLPHLAGKIVFVFPGQGAQYPGMVAQLYDNHHVFAAALDECDQALRPWTGWSVRDVVCQDPGAPRLDRADVVQPVLFAVMVSLAKTLGSYGIVPDMVIGHSQGEIAAAYVAGVFCLADAAKIVALRSAALARLSGAGAMASVLLPAHQLRSRLQRYGDALSIAAVNGPSHTIISGQPSAVEQFSAACDQDGIHTRRVAVDYASHSSQVEQLREHLLDELAGLTPNPAQMQLYSTVHSALSDQPLDTTVMNADYWYRNLREPVRLHDSVEHLLATGEHTFVELSPHPVLAPPIADTLARTSGRTQSAVITTLHRDHPDLDMLAGTIAQLHAHGHSPSWQSLYPHAQAVALPTYPFQHRSYWLAPTPTADIGLPGEEVLWNAIEDDAVDTVAKVLKISDAKDLTLEPVVHALRQWRKDLGVRSMINGLRYRVGWQTITPNTFPRTRQRLLVLAFPEQADDNAWIASLSAQYTDNLEVLAIDPSDFDKNSLTALLSDTVARTGCEGIVSFMALAQRPHPGLSGISTGLIATLRVGQAYGDSGLDVPLWVLTQGGVATSPDENSTVSPSQAAVWGLGQSICIEYPDRWGGLIDLPDIATARNVEHLHKILTCPQSEDQLAIRQHGISARRLYEAPLPLDRLDRATTWTTSGTALVTGATGRLGKHVARWLAEAGASHLILLSRHAAQSPQTAELEQQLDAIGVGATLVSVDVTDREALATVLADTRNQHGPIKTVVHAAATIGWHTISEITTEEFCQDYAKAVGADNLTELLDDEPPATFILFSSAAGVWGGAQQGAYAAANAHIDALASQLRANKHTTAISVAFGLWADHAGMPDEALNSFQRIGIKALSPETALAALQQSLETNDTLITIADVSWNQFLPAFTARRAHPLLTELASAHAPTTTNTTKNAHSEAFTARLTTQTADQQLRTLTDLVTRTTATVLAHPDPTTLDTDRPFKDLGIDSLSAVELRNTLARHTGLTLAPTLAFDHPTPATLARHLVSAFSLTTTPTTLVTAAAGVDEPVAVVGMACRFPGGVVSPASLWDVVSSKTDAVGRFPDDRGWDLGTLFDPNPDAVGKTYTCSGAFLAGAADFDAEFFGISQREAQAMDPQQRVFLELCWEALETAGIDPVGLAGSDTGVFAGAWSQPYGASNSHRAEGHTLTGVATSVVSGRVAYLLGLQGPAITVDTACSSSLVTTHLACQSLRNGESSLALAGGVTIMTTPAAFIEFARQRGLAVDGRCKAFAAAADGTGWGEGAAVVVLERLSHARRNHHPVLAVIAGSAINQDGASNGLTAPNGPAQQRVICQAAANAGISLEHVDVVEAHGTGTTLGDPIEAGAVIATYGAHHTREHPVWLGSIKSNLGHTQAAAGIAGLIKMIQSIIHGILPATLHVDRPSPHIDWSAGTVRVLTEAVAWPVTDHPRTAAVSSFGISGTNAHLIVQQAPSSPAAFASGGDASVGMPPLLVWAISARSPRALCAQAQRLHEHLISHPDVDLTDVAYSLATTRSHHPYRAVITSHRGTENARDHLLEVLQALGADQPHPQLTSHHHLPHLAGKIVFVFPGQGAQYPGMVAQLYDNHHVFAAALDECDQALRPWTGWSVRDVICQDPGAPRLDRADVVQPVLFAVMVSLAKTLGSYGIVPDMVIGHSQGEIAAAYVAGVFCLADAAKIVALRSAALARLSGAGAMASVLLPAHQLRSRLQRYGDALSIAAVNGPSHTIISGQPSAVEQFSAACDQDGIHTRRVAVDYASHSSQVEQLREHLLDELAGLTPNPAQMQLYSTVHSALSDQPLDTTVMNADYWYRNLREPVRLHDSVEHLLATGEHTFVELSPHPVLAPPIADTLARTSGRTQSAVITTLHRDHPDLDMLAGTIAQLHAHGHSPSWQSLYPHAQAVALPTYPFQHRSYWLAPTPTADIGLPGEEVLWNAIEDDAVDTVAKVLKISDAKDLTLEPVVHALRQWRKDLGVRSMINGLRYRVGWQTITPNTFPRTRQRLLVLAFPEQADDNAWIASLSAQYTDNLEVLAIDPSDFDKNSLTALLSDTVARTGCEDIVSFMALAQRPHPGLSGISTGLIATLRVGQAYGDSGLDVPLWVLTQGGVATSPDENSTVSPSQAAVWGLGQSICIEYPDRWGGLIDLPDIATARNVEHLHKILTCPQSEDQLAIRQHGISARRLYEAPLPLDRLDRATTWTTSGTALVTGATGRLGKHVARWLAEAGASHLILLSRHAAQSPQTAELEQQLDAIGVGATLVSVDVTDREALATVLADTRNQHGPIKTVVHAAATIGWHTISEITTEEFCQDYAKAVGADNLTELLDDEPPATFILFSSAAGVWGGAQQGAYAAANAHIDALASQLRANKHTTAISVAFGLWADHAGMPDEALNSFQRIGIKALSPETALAALQQSLETNDTLITIADVSWNQFLPAFTARRAHPLLTELASAHAPTTTNTTKNAHSEAFTARLTTQTADQQLRTLTDLVTRTTATVLAHPDPTTLDTDRPFKDLGIDSLSAVELRNTLARHTGLTLAPTLAFDHPTPATLAHYLGHRLGVADHPKSDDQQPGLARSDDERVRSTLKTIAVSDLRDAGLLEELLLLARSGTKQKRDRTDGDAEERPRQTDQIDLERIIDSSSPEELMAMVHRPDEGVV
ncbi:type I polyketide synthase [Mycobacterium decipiens]